MFTDQSTDLSLGAPCRALDAVRADPHHNFWIAGTGGRTSGSSGNTSSSTIQILQFHNDINEIVVTASYDIDGPGVRKVASCPYDKELVLVASEQRSSATLYRLPTDYAPQQNETVEVAATLTPEGGFGANIVDIAWRYDTSSSSDHIAMDGTNNSGTSILSTTSSMASSVGDVVTMDTNGHLSLWDMNTHQQVLSFDTLDNQDLFQNKGIPPPKVVWDPHTNGHTVAVTVPTQNQKHVNMVSIFDLRCAKENMNHNSSAMEIGGPYQAHYGIMDMDYNPNRPFMMGTACRDGTCKFYDLRQVPTTSNPTKRHSPAAVCVARGGHTHYCTNIRYNPFHDQLVVSTGTDRMSNLWRLSSCSSAPIILPSSSTTTSVPATTNPMNDDDDDDEYATNTSTTTNMATASATNVCVQRHEFSDSVYTTAWGANDAWIYLTISYEDGKAVLQHVPSTEKYKILL